MCGAGTQTATSTATLPEWALPGAQALVSRGLTESTSPWANTAGMTPAQLSAMGLAPGATSTRDMTIDQNASMQGVRDAQGAWMPYNRDATRMAGSASNLSAMSASAPYMNASRDWANAAGQIDGAGAMAPYMDAAGDWANAAGGINAINNISPYLSKSMATGALDTARPYIDAAGKSAAGTVGNYMNPYNSAVTDRLGVLAGRNLSENLLPQVNNTFVGAGMFGSDRSADFTRRAMRDTTEGLLGAQANVLQQGYQGALGAAQTDLARQAQLAGVAGGLADSDAGRALQAGTLGLNATQADINKNLAVGAAQGNLGNMALAGAQSGINRDLAVGAAQGNLGSLAQAGTNADRSGLLASSAQYGALGQQNQQQRYQDASSLMATGNQRQQQNMSQTNFNWDQLARLGSVMQGTPMPTTQTNTSPGPSIWSQLGGAALAGYGMYRGFKSGGRVQRFASGGSGTRYDDEDTRLRMWEENAYILAREEAARAAAAPTIAPRALDTGPLTEGGDKLMGLLRGPAPPADPYAVLPKLPDLDSTMGLPSTPTIAPDTGALYPLPPQKPPVPLISPNVLDAVGQVESSGGKNRLSPSGAAGKYGLMPISSQGIEPNDDDAARKRASEILNRMLPKFNNNLPDTLKAYHAGETGMMRHLDGAPKSKSGVGPRTENYWSKVSAALGDFNPFEAAGIDRQTPTAPRGALMDAMPGRGEESKPPSLTASMDVPMRPEPVALRAEGPPKEKPDSNLMVGPLTDATKRVKDFIASPAAMSGLREPESPAAVRMAEVNASPLAAKLRTSAASAEKERGAPDEAKADPYAIPKRPGWDNPFTTAGFAMMASRNPSMLGALGEAGLAGVGSEAGRRKEDWNALSGVIDLETKRMALARAKKEQERIDAILREDDGAVAPTAPVIAPSTAAPQDAAGGALSGPAPGPGGPPPVDQGVPPMPGPLPPVGGAAPPPSPAGASRPTVPRGVQLHPATDPQVLANNMRKLHKLALLDPKQYGPAYATAEKAYTNTMKAGVSWGTRADGSQAFIVHPGRNEALLSEKMSKNGLTQEPDGTWTHPKGVLKATEATEFAKKAGTLGAETAPANVAGQSRLKEAVQKAEETVKLDYARTRDVDQLVRDTNKELFKPQKLEGTGPGGADETTTLDAKGWMQDPMVPGRIIQKPAAGAAPASMVPQNMAGPLAEAGLPPVTVGGQTLPAVPPAVAAPAGATAPPAILGRPKETEQDKVISKDLGETQVKIQDGGRRAAAREVDINRLADLLDAVYTGPAAGVVDAAKKVASIFDIKLPPNPGPGEAATALGNRLALELKGGGADGNMMPGAMSNSDRDFLRTLVPGLENTPEGRRLMIDTLRGLAKRDQDLAKYMRKYASSRGGKIDLGFDDYITKEMAGKNYFDKDLITRRNKVPGVPPVLTEDNANETIARMKVGDQVIDPSGNTRPVTRAAIDAAKNALEGKK